MSAKVFNVFDRDMFLMKGTAKEIAEALDMPQTDTVYVYSLTGSRYHRRYTFVSTGERKERHREEPEVIKPKTHHEETLEYLKWHLNYYGNTTIKGSPREYVDELEREGIRFTTIPSRFKKGHYILERI